MLDYIPYIILFLLMFTFSLAEISKLKKSHINILRIVLLTALLFFVGLRYNTGADYGAYTGAFNALPNIEALGWETGYVVLMKLVKFVFGNYYILQFLASFVLIYSLNKIYSEYSKYPIYSIVLFVLIFLTSIMMAQVRQSIALSIVVLGTSYIFKQNLLKYTLVIFIASLFHISAIIAFPLYFLKRKISKSLSIIILLLAQIFFFIPNVVIDAINLIAVVMPERLEFLVHAYTKNLYARQAEFGTGLYYIASVILCIITLICTPQRNDKDFFCSNALLVTFVILALSNSVVILSRFLSYYYVYAIIALVNILDVKIKDVSIGTTKLLLLIFIFIYYQFPLVTFLTSRSIDVVSGKCLSQTYVPYYNVLIHPHKADFRKE